MQDNYQYKQLGLIYEAMANPSSTPKPAKTLQFKGKYTGPLTLRFDMAALQPFISGQNVSLEDYLAAIGVPDPDGPSPGPVALLKPMEIEYLVKMLNKFAGTSFGYDDTDLELVPGNADTLDDEDDDDNEEDAEGSYM
jgi:hypothetical protein